MINRDISDVLIIDNSPTAYFFQPENALPISSWYDDTSDNVLLQYIPFLKELSHVDDVRPVLLQLNAALGDNDEKIDVDLGL